MNKPNELTAQEWEDVAAVRAVQEGFGLEDEDDPAGWLSEQAYGVRFDYQTDSPGYVGPLFLIQGAGSPDNRPLTFIRNANGQLELVDTE